MSTRETSPNRAGHAADAPCCQASLSSLVALRALILAIRKVSEARSGDNQAAPINEQGNNVDAAGNEAMEVTKFRDTLGVGSTRTAQRGESGRLAGACPCLKSNYVGRVTSLPSDGDRSGCISRPTPSIESVNSIVDVHLAVV